MQAPKDDSLIAAENMKFQIAPVAKSQAGPVAPDGEKPKSGAQGARKDKDAKDQEKAGNRKGQVSKSQPSGPVNAASIQNKVTAERKEFIQSIMNELDRKAGVESVQEPRPGT